MEKREWCTFKGTEKEAEKAACICQDGGKWIETMDGYRLECLHCHAEIDFRGTDDFQILKGRGLTYREEIDQIFDSFEKE